MKKYGMWIFVALINITVIGLIAQSDTPFPPWAQQLWGDITISGNGNTSIGALKISNSQIATAAEIAGSKLAHETRGVGTVTNTTGDFGQHVAKFIFSTAVQSGSTGAYPMNVSLPAGAVVDSVAIKVADAQAMQSATHGTIAVSCEDANNLYTATDMTPWVAGTVLSGAPLAGTPTTWVKNIGAVCTINVTIASAAYSSGAFTGYVRYFQAD